MCIFLPRQSNIHVYIEVEHLSPSSVKQQEIAMQKIIKTLYWIVLVVLVATICMAEAGAINRENSNDFLNDLRTKRTTCTACPDGCSILGPIFISAPACPLPGGCPIASSDSCRCRCPVRACQALPSRCRLTVDDNGIIISDDGCDVACGSGIGK